MDHLANVTSDEQLKYISELAASHAKLLAGGKETDAAVIWEALLEAEEEYRTIVDRELGL